VQPTIYSAAAHHVRQENIDRDALYIIEKLTQAGYLCYLVGGSVRDLLMGHTPKDFDISTSARPDEIKRLFRNCLLIGRRFRLAHIRFGRKIIEVSTFRAGDTEEDNLIIRDNCWGTAEQDVLRRDFTLNGLFYSPLDDTVIDYVDGYRDLKHRLMRTIGNPNVRFKQDPVRMLRLLKFRARFGFAMDPDTSQALIECRAEIQKSSPARLLEELLKMLESGASAPFFRLMAGSGLLACLIPSLAGFLGSHEGSKIYALLEQTDQFILKNRRRLPDRAVLVANLLYPMLEARVKKALLQGSIELRDIASLTHQLLDEILLNDVPAIPKKLRATLTFVLNTQFRLSPLEEKRPLRSRIIHHPEFPFAYQFFLIRAALDPSLETNVTHWEEWIAASLQPRRKRREGADSTAVEEIF